MSEQVYAGIADGAPAGAPIGHGATYSAHPVSAAVALEVLRLYEEGGVLANGQRGARRTSRPASTRCARTRWSATRATAACSARWSWSATRRRKRGFDPALGLPDRIVRDRPTATAWCSAAFGDDILGFAPALIYTEDEFEQLFARLQKTLDDVLASRKCAAAVAA